MKPGWEIKPLSDFADCCLGKMLDKAKNRGTPQPYLRNVNVRWFEFELDDLLEMPFEDHERERYTARKGDLLICEGGYPGRAAIWEGDEPIYFQKAVHRVRFHQPARARWVLYYLWAADANGSLKRQFTGAGIQHLTGQALARLRIPLPPIEEQVQIVAVLDETFAAISTATVNAEKSLADAREMLGYASSHLLADARDDWQERTLEEVCAISSRLVDPKLDQFSDLLHIGAGNIESATGELKEVLTAREENLISGKFLFEPTMVLYSKIRPYLMKVCRPDFAGLCSADVYPLAPTEGVLDRNFLFHLLLSQKFTAYAEAGSARAGMPKVNRDHLFAFRFNLPPIEKQKEIAGRIDTLAIHIRDLTSCLERKLAELRALKQSLLHSAFSGELANRARRAPAPLNDNFGTPEFAAQIVAYAYERHVARNRARNFGTVKAEKILHMVEALGGIDLGRRPVRDAAGPDDAEHRHSTWNWARSNQFFQFDRRGAGHEVKKLPAYSRMIKEARSAVANAGSATKAAIELLVDMDTEFAELVATTHAAWNNLVLDGAVVTEDAIVRAARDDWHADKLRYEKSRFHDAIRFIRKNGIVPDGSAKRVGGQENLPL